MAAPTRPNMDVARTPPPFRNVFVVAEIPFLPLEPAQLSSICNLQNNTRSDYGQFIRNAGKFPCEIMVIPETFFKHGLMTLDASNVVGISLSFFILSSRYEVNIRAGKHSRTNTINRNISIPTIHFGS